MLLILVFTLGFSLVSWAQIPVPPVPQFLGIPDVAFTNLIEDDCRFCHNQNPPDGIPVDPTYLPDRHHNRIGTPIDFTNQTINWDDPNSLPFRDADGDGQDDSVFDCLNCHIEEFDPVLGRYVVQVERNCLVCHVGSPHHVTDQALAAECQACHGSFVDAGLEDRNNNNTDDAIDYGACSVSGDACREDNDCPTGETCNGNMAWIPLYQPSLVTPYPGTGDPKPNGGEVNPNNLKEQGNCDYCHDEGTIVSGIPDFIGKLAQDNMTNHHETGFGDPPNPNGPCFWCHFWDVSPSDPRSVTPIRTCENCHGIPSVHNIQYSDGTCSTTTTQSCRNDDECPGGETCSVEIIPGAEAPFNGHIGAQSDCNGCHGFTSTQSYAPGSGPVTPHVDTLSASSVSAGEATAVTVYGRAFQNTVQGSSGPIVLNSEVDIVASDGTVTTVQPDAISEAELTFTTPTTLSAGNYILNVAKYSQFSNAINFTVTPQAVVDSVTCSGGNTTITGSGFGSYLDAVNSGTSVTGDITTTTTTNETADINSWTATQIDAVFSDCPDSGSVVVNTVFSSGGDTGGGDPPGGGACSDYTTKSDCNADDSCRWKKKDGICVDEGSGGNNGGGKPDKPCKGKKCS